LRRLLWEKRGVRHKHLLPRLTVREILAWADAHHRQHKEWPQTGSGPIPGAEGETWQNVGAALRYGLRGLRGGSSLARLLQKYRGVRNPLAAPPLTPEQVVTWARRHRRQTGQWPTRTSGEVPGEVGESWSAINNALYRGLRGLPGGSSLARLLAQRCGVRNPADAPPLSVEGILALAEAHHRRSGQWPRQTSGKVAGTAHETWKAINKALRCGHRGLPGGTTLVGLLVEHGKLRNAWHQEPLKVEQVLAWAGAHRRRTGKWPTAGSGVIPEAPAGETWRQVIAWWSKGRRGLPGGSLAQALAARQGKRG
jgi:hypothetical protein